ncbi:MAG: hypothetical protein M0025_06820 [Elusimicrobia bacterium]|nr:hypothetical protein [Elusimicrobiota bacterium]
MYNRIKSLEALVNEAAERLAALTEENAVLKKQVEMLGAARSKASANAAAGKELAELKARVRRRLERICDKIERAGEGQPGLFDEDEE